MSVSEATGEKTLFCPADSCGQPRPHTIVWDVRVQKDGAESRTPLWWKCLECGKETERED
jgi:heterodisulfide reductase subunit C